MLAQLKRFDKSLYVIFLCSVINRVGTLVFPLLSLYLLEARGLSVARLGTIIALGSLGLLLGNLAGGTLADKWSRKRTLLLALATNITGYAGLTLNLSSEWYYALFLFIGLLGMGMYSPAANTLIADLTAEQERRLAYTINYICINIGMGIGPLLGGLLIRFSYQLVFLGDIASSAMCILLVLIGVREGQRSLAAPPERRRGPRAMLAGLGKYRMVLFVCLCAFCFVVPLIGLEYSIPLLVKTVFNADPYYIGLVYTVNSISILTLSLTLERILRGQDDLLMLVVGGGLWVAGISVLAFGFSISALLISTAIWSAGEIMISIVLPAFVAKRVEADVRGRFLSLNDFVVSLARLLSPLGLGYLWEAHGHMRVVHALLAAPALGVTFYGGLYLYTRSSARAGALPAPQVSYEAGEGTGHEAVRP